MSRAKDENAVEVDFDASPNPSIVYLLPLNHHAELIGIGDVNNNELTWNCMELSMMLEHVQARVAPTDVDSLLRRLARRVTFERRDERPEQPRVVYVLILDINYFCHFLDILENYNPMDDEPMWATDRVVAPTPGSVITISETANEFAIKGDHLTLIKGNQFDGEVKTWLDELNEGTITTWDELRTAFISRFFPQPYSTDS
ncbi:reverse transcriptase domain-containing protein [Tanacetum coccineum]|uniref:Reverse transcriptase domain-containing protein n=1 Tax=Tanacetum coccineum TaxID=301880 RepID=A0ABQ5B0M7_9ASTR